MTAGMDVRVPSFTISIKVSLSVLSKNDLTERNQNCQKLIVRYLSLTSIQPGGKNVYLLVFHCIAVIPL